MIKPAKTAKKFAIAALLFLPVFAAALNAEESPFSPVNPAFINYNKPAAGGKTRTPKPFASVSPAARGLGGRPSPVNLSHLAGINIAGALRARGIVAAITPQDYPVSYDLRTLGKLASVRDQGAYGSCWTFATYGSLESALLPAELRDFSENNLANNSGFDAPSSCGGAMNCGGTWYMSLAYLARWNGPVDEADDPYDGVRRTGRTVQKHLRETLTLPPRTTLADAARTTYINNVKSAIQSYGAVYATIYWDDGAYDNVKNFYNTRCNNPSDLNCSCAQSGSCGNHAITLVGWNDSYSKSNFAATPAGNGAFVARNSWGTGWGESGYFYISYYDTSLGGENAVFDSAESTASYTTVYQYDPLGWVGNYGNAATYWMSNIFTASAAENIKAVSFYTTDESAAYTVYVYTGVSASNPVSGTQAYSASGVIGITGYHTITLGSPVPVLAGQRFSVVVRLANPSYTYPLAYEYAEPGYSSSATASAGQSFVSANGVSWSDMTNFKSNANVCLKALAGPGDPPPTTTLTGQASGDSAILWAWPDISGETGYRVITSTGGDLSGDLPAGTTRWTETGLSPETTYYRQVAAFNSSGASTSAVVSVTTLPTPPALPYLNGEAKSSSTINWSWPDVTGETGYKVITSTGGALSGNLPAGTTYWMETGLKGSVSYSRQVAAFNPGGASTSAAVAITTLPGPPQTPASFSGAAAGVYSILWQWTDAADETAYLVIDAAGNNLSGTLPANTVAWTETGLSPETAYSRSIVAINSVGASTSSLAAAATLGFSLGAVKAYPVPWKPNTNGRFSSAACASGESGIVFSGAPSGTKIRIYSINGDLVRSLEVAQSDLNCKAWDGKNAGGANAASGVYIAVMENGGQISKKLVVER